MAGKYSGSAFDLKPSKFKGRWKDWDEVGSWLANELDLAMSARSGAADEINYCWAYYEQQRMRAGNTPWPDAADLPSPFAPEYVDAVHARLIQTVFVDPVWTVEGWGESAKRAPFVEEFHQRAQEDERLQGYADEWALRGLVEGVGTLEISEAYDVRRERVRKRVKLQLDETTQQPILGEDNQPLLAQDEESGDYLDAEAEDPASAEVDIDQYEPVRLGPDYDVIPYLDFYTLPAHARHRKQVWGYAKRFFRRVPELKWSAERGVYDKQCIEDLGDADERSNQTDEAPRNTAPVDQRGPTAQKELFEFQVLMDLDGDGERWWRITLHLQSRKVIRGKVDDRTTRYIRWMPFPKPGNIDRGYSLIGNKLITVLEEDTARRNMKADRMALKIGTPIKRLQGALWDPFEQPFGPRAVIDVRDMNEVQPMQGIEDVPNSVILWGREIRDDADRLIGQNDVGRGIIAEETSKPTATQVATTAAAAEVRVNVIVKRLQEPMEELWQARHTIWKRTLSTNPDIPIQRAMVIGRDSPGVDSNTLFQAGQNRVTAQLLEGIFWGKPRGSVETADPARERNDLNGLLQVLAPLMQMNPMIGMLFRTPPAAKALVEQVLRVYKWPDWQSFIGSEAGGVFDGMQQQFEQQQMQQQLMADPRMQVMLAAAGGMPQGMPGAMPPGAPPPGAPQEQPPQPQGQGMIQ